MLQRYGYSLLGAISGGGTSGGIYSGAATGDFLSNALILFNSDVQNVIQTAPDLGVDAAQQQLAGLGLTDTTLQTNILNQAFDADFVSTGEAYQGVIDYTSNNNIPYSFSATELNNFTGSTPEADLNSAIDAYVDPRYVDAGEVAAAAKLEGYTLTDDQVSQYVGQADQESVVADIRDEFDPQAVTTDEATQFFADLGYEPAQDEINQFVAQINESEQQQAVGEYVDPLMTSTEEATEFLTALGYEPSEEEIAQFVGQYGEEAQQAAIEKYVDPRLVTEEEVLNAFQVAGLPDVRLKTYHHLQDNTQKLTCLANCRKPTRRTVQRAEIHDWQAAYSGKRSHRYLCTTRRPTGLWAGSRSGTRTDSVRPAVYRGGHYWGNRSGQYDCKRYWQACYRSYRCRYRLHRGHHRTDRSCRWSGPT